MYPFLILTGASGVGKTSIARAVRATQRGVAVYLDEELAGPTEEFLARMETTEGPGGQIQRGFALYWIGRLAALRSRLGRPLLLDCQCRIAFLREALRGQAAGAAEIVLVECSDADRETRLKGRGSPELVHADMWNWSRYLHAEAEADELTILNTSERELQESVAFVLARLHGG